MTDLATTEKARPVDTSPLDLAEIAYGHELEREERVPKLRVGPVQRTRGVDRGDPLDQP